MGRILLFCTALMLATLSARAQEAPDAAIEAVIQSQIEAFLEDDFETAFTFASPAIKRIFGTPERFGYMVRNGYPMVWRPADVRFMELEVRGGRQHQMVMIEDGAGAYFMLDYEMVETENGWQINGVQILRLPEVGA